VVSSDLRPPAVGDIVAGKFELLEEIGSGGMGHVFRAVHRRLSQVVAIKVLHPSIAADPELRHRFEREARVLAQIRAPHVVSVLDVDVLPNGLLYIVLEHLNGVDAETMLHAQQGEPLPIADAVDWVHQAALGMVDTHSEGVVHRDLKPSNMFLCDLRPATTRRLVKIVDFGISKVKDDGRLTATSASFGTPLYMSPEQIRASSNVDERADIWSLGAILFELCTGQPPFNRPSPSAVLAAIIADPLPDPRTLRDDLPEELAVVLERCLQKDPAARYPTMQELANALAPFAPAERIARLAASMRAPGYRPPLTPPTGWQVADFAHLAPAPARTGSRIPTDMQETLTALDSSESPFAVRGRARNAVILIGAMTVAAALAVVAMNARDHEGAAAVPSSTAAAGAGAPSAPAVLPVATLHPLAAPGPGVMPPPLSAGTVEPPRPTLPAVDAGVQVPSSSRPATSVAPARRKPAVDPLAP
jgi:serine/threonine protein kinase